MSTAPMAGAVPASATQSADGILLGVGGVLVDVYVDFHSVRCKGFEKVVGPYLDELVREGDIRLAYHPVAMLDALSSTRYSSRAAASSGCASDGGHFPEYAQALFAHQPPEYTAGLTADELIQIGTEVGIADPAFPECVRAQRYEEWAVWVTVKASDRGVNWWPAVYVAGQPIRANLEEIRAALEAAMPAQRSNS